MTIIPSIAPSSMTVNAQQVDSVNVTLSTVMHCIYLIVAIIFTAILLIKVRFTPPNIRHFAICKVLTLDRLAYIILFGTVFKISYYFFLQFSPWADAIPCNPDGRFLWWALKIAIQFFVALRSRFSISCTDSNGNNTGCKWYKLGLLLISLQILQFIAGILRLLLFPDICATAGSPELWMAYLMIGQDTFVCIYSLCVFVIPLKRTLKLLEHISGGKADVTLNLWLHKVMIYSSIIILCSMMLFVTFPFVRMNRVVDKNETQLVLNGLLLVSSYCVVVQIEADIDAVKYDWIRKILIAFDCNNCISRHTLRVKNEETQCSNIVTSTTKSADSGTTEQNDNL